MSSIIRRITVAVVIAILLASLSGSAQSDRGTSALTPPPSQGRVGMPRTGSILNLNGRVLRSDELVLAVRTLQDGRTIAYRRSEADVALLVEALKEDGVTEASLLDPKNWLLPGVCGMKDGKCMMGACGGNLTCTLVTPGTENYKASGIAPRYFGYCACR